MGTEPATPSRAAVAIIVVANLLPLAGIVALEWRAYEALFVYWVETGLCIVLYYALALFARREPEPDEEDGRLHPEPASIPRGSGSVRPVGWVPPIRYRNVRYVPEPLVIALGFWFFSGVLFLDFPNPDLSSVARGPFREYVDVIAAAFTLEGLGLAVLLFGVRLALVGREFFGRRQYERYSASTLTDIPLRMACYWFGLVIVVQVLLLLGAVLSGGIDSPITRLLIIAVVVGSKLGIDRSLFRGPRNGSGRFAGWFVPREPATDRRRR